MKRRRIAELDKIEREVRARLNREIIYWDGRAARRAAASPDAPPALSEDPIARAEIERLAMEAVIDHERRLGFHPRDVSAENKGWDVESRAQAGHLRLIEVKGRHAGARDVILTKNEILASLNAPDSFHLALVSVEDGAAHEPVYVRRFFQRELGFAETAVVFDLADLLSLAPAPA